MEKPTKKQSGVFKITVMAILLVGACLLTYYFHVVLKTCIIFTHYFYIPIITASLWWKRRGIIVAIFLSVMLISTHIYFIPEVTALDDYLRSLILIAISIVVAILSEQIARKEEELLQVRENEYRKTFEKIEEGYYEADLAGNFIFFNDSTCRILGYPRNELMGMNYREYMDEDTAKKAYQVFSAVYSRIDRSRTIEVETIKEDATRKFIELSISLIIDRNGDPSGFRGIVKDITERKRMERHLLETQKMEAIGTLAGGIAHDFNNILAAIMGYASYLGKKASKGDIFHQGLEVIERSSVRAAGLTSQLLAYSRKGKIEEKPINMNDVVKNVYDTISGTLNIPIKIDLKTEGDLKEVKGDGAQLNQVVMNIVTNAREAMPEGGTLEIQTFMENIPEGIEKDEIELEPGEYVCIRFADTGKGMDDDTKNRIFEPYFSTKEDKTSTGLGMSVVYGIVKGHGGHIDVKSALNEGTEITICLPSSEAEEEAHEKDVGEVRGGTETILVIDDEKYLLSITGELLRDAGYVVYTSSSGKSGLETFKEKLDSIDLVILDIIMTYMDGKEVLERMLEIDSGVKVLLTSGYSEEDQHKDLLKMGASGFIGKPFVTDRLLRKIRSILD